MRNGVARYVPAVALLAVLGSGGWIVSQAADGTGYGAGMMGTGMNGAWLAGDGKPVEDLQQARVRAEEFAAELDPELSVGEVMEFTENYYAELENSDGTLATEILVDPGTGAVQFEHGPAMMWNEDYGVMATPSEGKGLTAAEARRRGSNWAKARGLELGEADAFPGYYTMHTVRGGEIDGMVSVNASTGRVWLHSWHGEFLDMEERQ